MKCKVHACVAIEEVQVARLRGYEVQGARLRGYRGSASCTSAWL